MSMIKGYAGRTRTYTPVCDMCGAELETQYDFDDAVEAKKNAGWKSRKLDGEWIDLCQDCQPIMERRDR